MNDRTFYDEAFFAELDQPIPLRKQVVEWIDRYCATTGKSHSFAWRKAYLELEEVTGFRVPDKKGLDAVEKAGRMQQLLDVVKKLPGNCGDHATEVNSAIPDYIPYESDRSRWKTNATKPCAHENPIPDYVPHVSDRSRLMTNGTKSCDHEWGVFSTVLEDVSLLVQCVECGAYGKVSDPSADEWQQAFYAPSNPYHWPDNERVEPLPGKEEDPSKRHIVRGRQGLKDRPQPQTAAM